MEANGKYFLSMLKVAQLKLTKLRCRKNIHSRRISALIKMLIIITHIEGKPLKRE